MAQMVDWMDYPAALRPLIPRMQAQIDDFADGLFAGELTPSEFENSMSVLISRYHTAALRAGQQSSPLSDMATAILEGLTAVQLAFLSNFVYVIRAAGSQLPDFEAQFRARARSYGLAIKTAYEHGDIIRQVGRPLPLPAMPCQGTQCGNNCLCGWRIETVDDTAGDYDAYWERHANDSCQTCVIRAEMWNPVRIRDGRLVVDYRLKHLAGQHDQSTHAGGKYSHHEPGLARRQQVMKLAAKAREKLVAVDKKAEMSAADKARIEELDAQIKPIMDKMKAHLLAGGSMEQMREIDSELRPLSAEKNEINRAHQAKKKAVMAEARKSLEVDNPLDCSLTGRSKAELPEHTRANVETGLAEFNRMVDVNVVGGGGGKVNVLPTLERSSFEGRMGLSIRTDAGPEVTVHEMGHWLEHVQPRVKGMAERFLARRTAGESEVSLSSVANERYDASEVTRPDNFLHPYMGKSYRDYDGGIRGTEIMSMGLEMFFSNPAKLARLDPDYFDFIFGVVRGVTME